MSQHIFDKLDLPISGSGGTSSVSFVNNPKSVAAQFSASVGYTKGQLVYYDNALYRFTADHAAGAWNSGHVTAVTVAGELKAAQEEFSELKKDLNATIGIYKKKFDWAKLATSSYPTGWRQGLYGRTAGGINNTSATNVRSVSTNAHYLSECNAFTIYPPSGCTVWVCEYDNLETFNESHYVKTWDGVSTNNPLTVIVTEGHGYGITIRSDSDAISPTAEFVAQIVMHQHLPLIDEVGSVKAEADDIKTNLQKATEGDYSTTKIDNGVWAVGSVTSSGLNPSATKEAHSGLFEIGDYDYIDVKLTDQTCKFIVYRYDGTNYSVTPEVKNIWITRGGIRLFDKQYKYIIRASSIPYEVVTDPSVYKESVQVYGGKNKSLCYVEDLSSAINSGVFEVEPNIPLAMIGVSSSRYEENLHNATSVPIEIGDYDSILFKAIDTGTSSGDAYYAVYTYDGTTYSNVSGGWASDDLEFTNKNVKYILRVALVSVSGTFTDEQFEKACNAVKICKCIKNNNRVSVYGYERQYTDITSSLTFEQKAISTTGIEDSTVSLLAKLPNNGNIECRLNRPAGKFSVWKSSGSGFTCLTNGWTYYQYRYTGDYSSDYYVAVATPEDATITLSYFNVVGVYKFLDVGVKYHEGASLSGKNIAVFGDSIVQGRMIKNGSSVNCTMPKPYSNLLAEVAGTEAHNFGIGGATVYDNNWKALARNYVYVTGFDIVFVCAGTNDFGSSVDLEDFQSAYETVIDGLVATNTEVVICTPTRRGTNSTIGGNTLQDFADIELAVAQERELKVIDLYSLTDNAQFKSHLPDNLHPTEIGARMIADLILNNY